MVIWFYEITLVLVVCLLALFRIICVTTISLEGICLNSPYNKETTFSAYYYLTSCKEREDSVPLFSAALTFIVMLDFISPFVPTVICVAKCRDTGVKVSSV